MRFSTLLTNTAKKAIKNKNIDTETAQITDVITTAFVAYNGTAKGMYKGAKKLTFESSRGCVPMSILDDATLIQIIKTQHTDIVINNACDDGNITAEISRAIAKDKVLLGALYTLINKDEASNSLL